MSEVVSDVLEDMVRTELTHQATAPQPDPDRILHRVRITRRRTTTMTSAAVMVLVIVVGATVWTALPHATGPTATPLPAGVRLGQPPALWFTDPDHGYALVNAGTCPGTCDVWLAYTSDGGHSWHGHQIPGAPLDVRMRVFGDTTIVLDTVDGQRWYTTDSGASWITGRITVTGDIDHIPPGAAATVDSTTGITVLTTDGRTHRLTTAPATTTGDIHFAADGSAWIRGNPTLVSRDAGRTWQPVALPTEAWGNLATHDGVHLYHTDGRHIWRKTGQAEWVELTPPPAVWGELHAQPDGGVITTGEAGGQAYYAGPDDTGFQRTQRPDLARSGYTGARRVRPTGDGWEHTADGQTWTPLRF
jgi:hypothetical protein